MSLIVLIYDQLLQNRFVAFVESELFFTGERWEDFLV